MEHYICGTETYRYYDKSRNLSLPVSILGLPYTITVEGKTLLRKSNFHISIVSIGKIIERYGIADPAFEQRVLEDFCTYTKDHPVSFERYHNEFYFVSEEEKRSVIVMCDVANLKGFFDLLNTRHSLEVEVPPTHVTIYTLQPDIGIFVTSSEDIAAMAKHIENPVGMAL